MESIINFLSFLWIGITIFDFFMLKYYNLQIIFVAFTEETMGASFV